MDKPAEREGDLFPEQSLPNTWDALSGFVKAIRLRHTDDAVLWLAYLWQQSQERSRVQRRLLIGSAEDGISVDVIGKVSDWYGSPERKSLEAAAAEVVRICSTTNWWGQADGWEYICAWRKAELTGYEFRKASLSELFKVMHEAIQDKALTYGLAAFNAAYVRRNLPPKALARLLLAWADEFECQQAKRLAHIYEQRASALWMDGNVSGQAYYALIHGTFGKPECPEVDHAEVLRLLTRASERLKEELVVPSYALDGVHTRAGSDKRFSGILQFMMGSCLAFQHYGRLSPEDAWLPEFMEVPNVA